MLESDKKNIEMLWKRNFETDLNSVQEAEHPMELKLHQNVHSAFRQELQRSQASNGTRVEREILQV